MKYNQLALLLAATLVGTYGCGSTSDTSGTASTNAQASDAEQLGSTTPDFESPSFYENIPSNHAQIFQVSDAGVTQGKYALKVEFESVSDADKYAYWPNVRIQPDNEQWNWNAKGSLSVDITNPTDADITVILKLADNVGMMGGADNQLNYQVSIAANSTEKVEMLFNGTGRALAGYWGGTKLDLRKIKELQIFVQGPVDAQTAIFDNFQLVGATGDFIAAQSEKIEAGPVPTVKALTTFKDLALVSDERSVATTRTELEDGGVEVVFTKQSEYPNISFKAQQPWDWSQEGAFNLAFDIENPSEDALQLYVRVDQAEHSDFGGSADGQKDSMVGYMTLAPGSNSTYYLDLQPATDGFVSGMRSEPPKLAYNAQAISYGWGEKSIDTSAVHSVQLFLMQPKQEHKIVVKSLRLIPNLAADTSRFNDIVDQFGQFTGSEWDEKVHNTEQLIATGKAEVASIDKVQPMSGRSKFGGWTKGPKFEATGFFRTEKKDGQWNVVDPEGHPFFVTGIDNIRFTDTMTITGVDYEDLVTRKDAQVKSQLRRDIFTWLPDYDDRLAQAYDHVPFVHIGAVEKGEVFSFYLANLMRKYEAKTLDEAVQTWEKVTIDRMVDWGFTTLGNWSDPNLYDNKKVAYVANGWIMFGDTFKRISTGNDYWGALPDPYDPDFKIAARKTAQQVASEVDVNDPWLLGVFIDNEMSWGNTKNQANHYGLMVNAMSYDAAVSPAKQALSAHLQDKYQQIEALNKAWGTKVASWSEFDAGFAKVGRLSKGMKADYSEMLQMVSEQYFSTVRAEIKKVLPNHMYLGARFADWGQTPEIVKGAAPYVDVMSYNLYANDLQSKGDWSKLPDIDKPSIIGEFHFGSTDTGMFHGGIVSATDQGDRADKYVNYMTSIVNNPYFVGAHWFQYTDSPVAGRAWDGENYNVGFVTVTDTPYIKLVEAAKQFNRDVYKLRFKEE